MARVLILSLDGVEYPVTIRKVDREKLYGAVEVEAFDEKGNKATLKILAADGKTLIDKGGTALATVNEKGDSIDRNELIPVTLDAEPIEQVPSSFNGPNVLEPATIDDYLLHIVKSVYLLEPGENTDLKPLIKDVEKNLYSFPFSYRGGNEYDIGYVIGADKSAFLVVGKQATYEFVKLNQAVALDAEEEEEISADEIDFDLL